MLPSWVWAEPRSERRGGENPGMSIHHAAESAKRKGNEMRKPSSQTLLSLSSTCRNTAAAGRDAQPKAPCWNTVNYPVCCWWQVRSSTKRLCPRKKAHCHGFQYMFLFSICCLLRSYFGQRKKRDWVTLPRRRHWFKHLDLSFKTKADIQLDVGWWITLNC